jgi:hypothetical protein
MLPIGKRDNRVRNDRGRPPLAFARCPKVSQTALVSACPSNKDIGGQSAGSLVARDARMLIGVIFGVATMDAGRVSRLRRRDVCELYRLALPRSSCR